MSVDLPEEQTLRGREWRHLLGLVLVGLGLFVHRLGVPGLMDPDEGRYAEIAREIWVLKDWLIPHLNLLPYLEKPPLVYWLTALSFGGLGLNEWAARLPSALAALGGVLTAYGLGRALWGPLPGFLSGLVLATSGGYVVLGRILTLDMALAFSLNLGVGLGYLALSRGRRRLWPWAYLALALGVLTKGPVAVVLPLLIWGLWCGLTRFQNWRDLLQPLSWLLLAAVSLPWFAYVVWRYPPFLKFFLWEQHLGRYLTASIHYQEPFYYYGPVLLALFLPWSWLLGWALGRLKNIPGPDRLFLLVWGGVILVFFSLSRGKLASYILPALLPLALLLGGVLAEQLEARKDFVQDRGLFFTLTVWLVLGWVLVVLYFWSPPFLAGELAKTALLSPFLPLCLVVLALTPTLALLWRRLEFLFLGALLLGLLIPGGIEGLSTRRSPRELGRVLASQWQPGSALIGWQLYSQGVSFYSGQAFHLLIFRSELDFGRRLDPHSGLFFASPAEMAEFAESQGQVFFFLRREYYSLLERTLFGNFSLLAQYKDCILVAYKGK